MCFQDSATSGFSGGFTSFQHKIMLSHIQTDPGPLLTLIMDEATEDRREDVERFDELTGPNERGLAA